jgi:hypothetical protein
MRRIQLKLIDELTLLEDRLPYGEDVHIVGLTVPDLMP